jgi:hypothetical protein
VNDYFFLKNIGHGSFGDVKLATKDLIEDDLTEEHQRFETIAPALLIMNDARRFAVKMLKRIPKKSFVFSRAHRPSISGQPSQEQSDDTDLEQVCHFGCVPSICHSSPLP